MKKLYFTLLLSFIFLKIFAQSSLHVANHYVFNEFNEGTIIMKSGEVYKLPLNYNSLTEEMVFDENGQKMAIGKDKVNEIDTIIIKDKKFIVCKSKFYELISKPQFDLLVLYKCYVKNKGESVGYGISSETASITKYSSINSNSAYYNLNLPGGYDLYPFVSYVIKKGGDFQSFKSMKQLKKIYSNKKELLKTYTNQHEVVFNNVESILQLVQYIESN